LVFGLARRGMLERARAVEGLMGEVVEACRAAAGEIWGTRASADGRAAVGSGEGTAPDGELDLVRGAGEGPPALPEFARLSLLG